jgi:hypothetical protein
LNLAKEELPMPSLRFSLFAAVSLLVISGCETTTSAPAKPIPMSPGAAGYSQDQARAELTTFMLERAKAEIYAAGCRREGIALRTVSRDAQTRAFLAQMKAKGYSESQLKSASAGLQRPSDALGVRAVNEMVAMGVKKGDIGSLCAAARKEIASATPAGSMLVQR